MTMPDPTTQDPDEVIEILAGAPLCDHCQKPLHHDMSGYWVGADDTSDCPVDARGHTVDGSIR